MISDINKETGAMGLIHVYYAAGAPCDDPEDQLESFHRVDETYYRDEVWSASL